MVVPISVAIESSFRRFGIVRKVKRSQAVHMWGDIVGSGIDKVSNAVMCKDGVLFVEVENSVWAQELSLIKINIIKKINKTLGKGTVKDIRFRTVGIIKKNKNIECNRETGNTYNIFKREPISEEDIEKIRNLASNINDPQVQNAFIRYAITTQETCKLREGLSNF